MATWRAEILYAMSGSDSQRTTGETWDDVVACTLSDAELDKEFDAGFGSTCGKPFTVWTKRYVYFPVCYDGAEDVGFVSRDPDGKPTQHWGGG